MMFNEEEGTITVTSEKVDDSTFADRLKFKIHCYFVLRKDMCDLFGWIKYTTYDFTIIAKHGPNLVLRKRGNAFVEDRTDSRHYGYRYGLLEIVFKGKDGVNIDCVEFYLDEFTHTFTNLKESTYKNGTATRTLYFYFSLCAPVMMGNQITDLLRTFEYRLLLKGSYYYEPRHVHDIALRNHHIQEVETQLSELENNNLAQFTNDGASIVTLHFRRIK